MIRQTKISKFNHESHNLYGNARYIISRRPNLTKHLYTRLSNIDNIMSIKFESDNKEKLKYFLKKLNARPK